MVAEPDSLQLFPVIRATAEEALRRCDELYPNDVAFMAIITGAYETLRRPTTMRWGMQFALELA